MNFLKTVAMKRASVKNKAYRLSDLLHDFPQERYYPVGRNGELLSPRPRFWLYVYFRFFRKGDSRVVSGCRPFQNSRQALRFISLYAGKNLIDDIYFVDSKERKSYDVYPDYVNIKLLPIQTSLEFEYD